jgi:hypothetical protein
MTLDRSRPTCSTRHVVEPQISGDDAAAFVTASTASVVNCCFDGEVTFLYQRALLFWHRVVVGVGSDAWANELPVRR